MYRRSFLQKTKWILILTAFLTGAAVFANGVDRENRPTTPEAAPTPEQALERFTTNLTRAAAEQAALFMGRAQDRLDLLTALEKKGPKAKKVIFLVGPSGAGKTALVEAVAGDLKGREIHMLDVARLTANTPYRNELETRIDALLSKAMASEGRIILFLDEFHSLMKMDGITDVLKKAIDTGKLTAIAATTHDEYREFVEKDPAIASRFAKQDVTAMSKAEALEMLRAAKPFLVQTYGFTILDSSLKVAVDLAARYYGSSPLSRKAYDLVEETMSRVSTQLMYGATMERVLQDRIKSWENQKKSFELDLPYLADAERESVERRIGVLTKLIERAQRKILVEKKGGTPTSVNLDITQRDLYQKERELAELKKNEANLGRDERKRLVSLEAEIRRIRDVTLVQLRSEFEAEAASRGREKVVGPKDLHLTVSVNLRIPMNGINSSADERVARFSNLWQKNIFGQDHIRISIERKMLAREKGLEPNLDKPVVLMFNGPTGTGKTEGAKMMAEGFLFDTSAFIRIDMGQHQTEMALGTLFGSGRGYVNQAEGGVLTEAVRQRPFAVLLLDEYEKAFHGIDKVLLKIMDEGRIQDNSGRWVDFRNVIIVITTNITAEWMFDRAVLNIQEIEQKYGFREGELKNLTMEDVDREVSNRQLQNRFAKEFLARVDLKLNYNPINETTAIDLSRKEFKRQADALADRHGVKLIATESAILALAQRVMNSPEGGREAANSRRNFITDYVLVDAFDKKNNVQRGQELVIDFEMDANRTGGDFKVTRAGQTLSSVRMLMPVRLSQASGGASGLPPGSREVDRSEMMRMIERSQGSQDAARGQNPGIVDSKGQPIRSTPAEAGRARGK